MNISEALEQLSCLIDVIYPCLTEEEIEQFSEVEEVIINYVKEKEGNK